ncbi:unnamed protein product, partial [Didymodactylos carnosus]
TNPETILKITTGTCYLGLECSIHRLGCLDWREICDGKCDCLDRCEDEAFCSMLRENTCKRDDEYQCLNKMCVPSVLSFDKSPIDCVDGSDETVGNFFHRDDCFKTASDNCDEISCDWLEFTCGDGQCKESFVPNIYHVYRPEFNCANGRDLLYTRNMLTFENNNGINVIFLQKTSSQQHSKTTNVFVHEHQQLVTVTKDENLDLLWHCNRGILIESTNPGNYCLCSQNYYGSRCQYQSEHILINLFIATPTLSKYSSVMQLLILMIDSAIDDAVVSYDYIYHFSDDCIPKYSVQLLYPKIPIQFASHYYIRIDAYNQHEIGNTNTKLEYKASWYFDIDFSFLPVNRLSTVLIIPEISHVQRSCSETNLTCVHGRCTEYLNTKQFFCHCEMGWSGKNCSSYQQCGCANDSICIARKTIATMVNLSPICLCQLGKTGRSCHASNPSCSYSSCSNGGTCVPLDVRHLNTKCICPNGYTGLDCSLKMAEINILFQIPKIPLSVIVHCISEIGIEFSFYERIPLNLDQLTIQL